MKLDTKIQLALTATAIAQTVIVVAVLPTASNVTGGVTSSSDSASPIIRQICTKDASNCKCTTTEGQTIDLSPLAKKGQPRFVRIFAKGEDSKSAQASYAYNPCYSYTITTEDVANHCTLEGDVAVCQNYTTGSPVKNQTKQEYGFINLGTQKSAVFEYLPETDTYYVTYNAGGTDKRTSEIALRCNKANETTTLLFLGEDKLHYKFLLVSPVCCPKNITQSESNVNAGIIAAIAVSTVTLVFLVVYFSIGFCVAHKQKKKPFCLTWPCWYCNQNKVSHSPEDEKLA